MAPRAIPELPTEGFLYEVKWDGYRSIVIKYGERVRLLSRNNKDLSPNFPGVIESVRALKCHTAVIDAELVALDPHGRPSFSALGSPSRRHTDGVHLYAFDLLQVGSRDVRERAIEERRDLLKGLLESSPVRFSEALAGSASDVIGQVRRYGLEGVVAKRLGSAYRSGDSKGAWVKKRLNRSQEFVVGGYEPSGSSVDSLLVGYFDGQGRLVFAGSVRGGLNPQNRRELGPVLKHFTTDECPFHHVPSGGGRWGGGARLGKARWVQPVLVVQIDFVEWTSNGQLRHPAYLGARPDKQASEVVREA